jgi:hypothetical protein
MPAGNDSAKHHGPLPTAAELIPLEDEEVLARF